jgi:hypothetical protein
MPYSVRVEWLPRRAWLVRRIGAWRRGKKGSDLVDAIDPLSGLDGGDGVVGCIVAALVAVVVVLLLWWVVIPLLLLVVDVVVVAVLVVGAVLARVLLRRPWDVVVHHRDQPVASVAVVGWRAARRARDRIAAALADGSAPEVATELHQS